MNYSLLVAIIQYCHHHPDIREVNWSEFIFIKGFVTVDCTCSWFQLLGVNIFIFVSLCISRTKGNPIYKPTLGIA
jgi:hypothetical protein